MDLEITPEPTKEEREAVAAALAAPNDAPSAWWLAGIEEATSSSPEG
jgi:hypothetical protein